MAFFKKAKAFGKRVAKKAYGAAKKRYVKKGGPNVANITKDVMMLKRLINVEKKRFDMTSPSPITFGQTAGAGITGAQVVAISPTVAEGAQGNQRNGISFKIVSACLDLYFNQSVNAVNGGRIRWWMVMKPDNGINIVPANVMAQMLENNPFSGVVDYHSPRDAEYFSSYRVIKQGTVNLVPDSLTGQIAFQQRKYPLKITAHQRFQGDASTVTTKNAFFLIFTMDVGDAVALTGAQVQYNVRWYYTDN